jgi:hypothetical protein
VEDRGGREEIRIGILRSIHTGCDRRSESARASGNVSRFNVYPGVHPGKPSELFGDRGSKSEQVAKHVRVKVKGIQPPRFFLTAEDFSNNKGEK